MNSWELVVEAAPADEDGPAVSGALVEVIRRSAPQEIVSATTDGDGVARVPLPGAGDYIVSLTHNLDGGGVIVGDGAIAFEHDGQHMRLPTRLVS